MDGGLEEPSRRSVLHALAEAAPAEEPSLHEALLRGDVSSVRRRTGVLLFAQQVEALLVKNATLTWRNKPALAVQFLATFFFVLLIYGVNGAIELQSRSQNTFTNVYTPAVSPVASMPDCAASKFMLSDCYTLLWTSTPANSIAALDVVASIQSHNSPPIPDSRVRRFDSVNEANVWMQTPGNFARTLGLLELWVTGDDAPTATSIDFGIQINGTSKLNRGVVQDDYSFVLLPLQQAAEREIVRYLSGSGEALTWDLGVAQFPRPAADSFSVVGTIAPTFLLAAAMFTFTIQIFNVVTERELKLRSSMRVMGVSDLAWWLSWLLWDVFFTNVLQAFTICAFGCAFPFDLFRRNQFSVLFVHFWLFEVSLTGMAYFFSTFISKSSGATVVGFVIYLFGFIFQVIVSTAGLPYSTSYGSARYGSLSKDGKYYWLQVLFSFFPPTLFAKGLRDLGLATASDSLPGIKWRTRDSYCYCNPLFSTQSTSSFEYIYGGGLSKVPSNFKCSAADYATYNVMFPAGDCDYSINWCYCWFIATFVLFFLLALYFDKVNADEFGVRKSPLFLLDPSFWLGRSVFAAGSLEAAEEAAVAAGSRLPQGLDDDVQAEEEEIKARLRASGAGLRSPPEDDVALEVRGLTKSFGSFHAVRGNFFRVETGKLFALLGPNGAGKTTTINLLTGVLPITSGDAQVCGRSIVGGELPAIRRLMGVCPQFDILWDELTAREHLRLFAALKGLPRSLWNASTTELLERTKLSGAADRRSSSFSGGMKRRLSVAIALIGDPEIVYLDEPTTGMDPITRRYVWDIILDAKAGRAIVLTTHSMEEADILADNITIIAKGRLRCFGSALRLKNKFGAGYRISVSCAAPGASSSNLLALGPDSERREALHQFFSSSLGVTPSEVGRVYTTFTIPRSVEEQLPAFLQALTAKRSQLCLSDLQVSLTTLEQVFLLIARDAEKQAAAADGRTVKLGVSLGEGQPATMVEVPWGAEQIIYGATGEALDIVWVQDDEGRLMYSHHIWRGEKVEEAGVNAAGAGAGGRCCGLCC